MQIRGIVNEAKVLVDQALVYTVRVSSAEQLEPFEPNLIPASGWQGRTLRDGARVWPEMTQQGQRWVYEFDFALVPLSPGRVALPVAQASVRSLARATGPAPESLTKLEVSNPPVLQVESKPGSVMDENWLPASDLKFSAQFQPPVTRAEVGQALVLWVTVLGKGVSSDQLPSLQDQLMRSGYDLHLQEVQRQHWRDADGILQAHSVERYQLIPRTPGLLTLPALQVQWFDLNTRKMRSIVSPAASLSVEIFPGAGQHLALNAVGEAGEAGLVLLPPLVLLVGGFILLLSAWWIFWFSRHPNPFGWWWGKSDLPPEPSARPVVRFVPAANNPFMPHSVSVPLPVSPAQRRAPLRPESTVRFVPAANNPFVPAAAVAAPVTLPKTHAAAAVRRTPQPLPRPVQGGLRGWWRGLRLPAFPLWECLRCIKTVDEPSTLCHLLQNFACKQFGTPLSTPLKQISSQIHAAYPALDQNRLEQLLGELDDATYGRGQLDIRRWKRAFRRLMWPTFFLRPRATTFPSRRRSSRGHLPELNPRA